MSAAPRPVTDYSNPVRQEQLLAVLDPIVRIAIKNGVSASDLVGLAREALVDAARDHSACAGVQPHVSRLALDSGLTQSEVQAAIASKRRRREATEARRRMNEIVTRVATTWVSESRFSGPYGTALQLRVADSTRSSADDRASGNPQNSNDHSGPTFEELVLAVDERAKPIEVLCALLERGAISWSGEDERSVTLTVGFQSVIEQGADPTFEYVTGTLAGLGRTLAANAYSLYPVPKLFERRAIGDRPLDARALKLVNEILRSKLSVVLESVVDELEAPKAAISGTPDARCSVGVYVMAEPVVSRAPAGKQSFLKEIDLASSNARASLRDETESE